MRNLAGRMLFSCRPFSSPLTFPGCWPGGESDERDLRAYRAIEMCDSSRFECDRLLLLDGSS